MSKRRRTDDNTAHEQADEDFAATIIAVGSNESIDLVEKLQSSPMPPLFVGQQRDAETTCKPEHLAQHANETELPTECERAQTTAEVCLRDLPHTMTEPLLEELLIQFGPLVDHPRVLKDRGLAFAEYHDAASAQYVIAVLNGFRIGANHIRVSYSHRSAHLEIPDSQATTSAWTTHDKPYKITQCVHFAKGKCRNGDQCTYAHGEYEERVNREKFEQEVQRKQQARAEQQRRAEEQQLLLQQQHQQLMQQQRQQQQLLQQQQQQQQLLRQQQQLIQQQNEHEHMQQQKLQQIQQLQRQQHLRMSGQHALQASLGQQPLACRNGHTCSHHQEMAPAPTCFLGVGPTNPYTAQGQVERIISSYGQVQSVLMQPQHGFAIVTMTSLEHAIRAKECLDGKFMSQGSEQFILKVQYLTGATALAANPFVSGPSTSTTCRGGVVQTQPGGGAAPSGVNDTADDAVTKGVDEW